jgi:hypothetical protein
MPNPTAASAAATDITIKQKLTDDVAVVTRESDECQIHRIQHQLDAHEHPDRVALEYHADRADRKEYS